MEATDLTAIERRLWNAFPHGEDVGFSCAAGEAEHGRFWDKDRTIRAEVIRALLVGGKTSDGEIAALRLEGVRISGQLDLMYGIVPYPVELWGCHFDRTPLLYGLEVRQLVLSDCYLPALDAATIRVGGVLRISDCRIPGQVRLGGAKIVGAFFLDNAHLGRDNDDGLERNPVLQLNHATFHEDVSAPRLVTHGQVRLTAATIIGTLNLDDAHVGNPGRTALEAESLTVGSNLNARRLHSDGMVNLRGTKIPGQLDFTDARLSNPRGVALQASSCTIGELWLSDAAPIEGTVNLRGSQLKLLHATREVWPTKVNLDGLTYGSLAPHLPANQRLELLERDRDGYVPHAYEQLAAAYRRTGDDAAARAVQLAKQRRHRTTLPWYAKFWGHVQDVAVGYGFRPTRAMAWLLALLLVGTAIYGLHHPQPMEPGKAPDFNSFVYTLDLLLPVIDFGQEKAFNPHGPHQWLAYLLIAAGWILATTVAAGITRAVSRR